MQLRPGGENRVAADRWYDAALMRARTPSALFVVAFGFAASVAGSALTAACGSDDGATSADASAPVSDASNGKDAQTADAAPAEDPKCHATPRPEGGRVVFATRPRRKRPDGAYDNQGTLVEVLKLATDGTLTRPGITFDLGGPPETNFAFTPDGQLAVVGLGAGKGLATVRIAADGSVSVVTAATNDSIKVSANELIPDADGKRLYALDPNTTANGGGLHAIRLHCDGTLSDEGLVLPGERATAFAFLAGADKALYVGGKAGDLFQYLQPLTLTGATATASGAVKIFPDEDAIPSSVAVTPDGKYALVNDVGFGAGNRVGVVDLASLTTKQVLALPGPEAIVPSPFGNALLFVQSDTNDAYRLATYDASNTTNPIGFGPKLAVTRKVELPSNPVTIATGALKGRVLLAEVSGVRQVQFAADGTISDKGLFSMDVDKDLLNAVENLGVQP